MYRLFHLEPSNACHRILKNHAAKANEDVAETEVPIDEFFEEILLSYRLMFGQDERSWKAMAMKRILAPSGPAREGHAVPIASHASATTWGCDPLLPVLCCGSADSPEAREVYDEIEIEPRGPSSNYVPYVDFRFFRKRLLDLQDFIDQHQPRSVRGLLNDRRDVAAWYTLWNNQVYP